MTLWELDQLGGKAIKAFQRYHQVRNSLENGGVLQPGAFDGAWHDALTCIIHFIRAAGSPIEGIDRTPTLDEPGCPGHLERPDPLCHTCALVAARAEIKRLRLILESAKITGIVDDPEDLK